MEDKGISLKKNILWNSIGNITYLFLQWLITIVIVRVTTYREAGIYSLAISLTNVLSCIALWGVRNYQVSDISNKYSDGEYVIARYITCFITFIACISVVLINSYNLEQSAVIIVYMIFRIGEAFVDVLHGIDQKEYRMDYIGRSFILRGVLSFLVFSFALIFTRNLIVSILFMTIATFAVIIFYDYIVVRKVNNTIKVYKKKNVYKLLKEGIILVVYMIAITAIPTVPRYFLEKMYGQNMFGIYATIATPAVLIQAAISYIISPLIGPISEYFENGNKKKILYYITVPIIGIFVFLLFCLIAVNFIGDFCLEFLFGEEILAYSYLLAPALVATAATAISLFVNTLLTIFRNFKGLLFSNLSGLYCSIIFSKLLISNFSLNGTSFTHIISMIVQVIIGSIFIFFTIKHMSIKKKN
ncbi:MAG TPA: oligosaccharide flippase family protein [Clostridiales bacterium]|nr:oligosaccharide flippase family protein [Clostridiales bacterium]